MKPVVAVDFDDVVFDFNGGFIRWHNERYGTTVAYQDLFTHDMTVVWQLELEELLRRVDEFHRETDAYWSPAMPGAHEALHHLKESYQLEIVTARSVATRAKTLACLEALDLEVFSAVHFTNEYDPDPRYPTRSKVAICQEINAIALLEDAPRNAAQVAPALPVLLPDRPWNQGELPTNVIRVHSWTDIFSALEQL